MNIIYILFWLTCQKFRRETLKVMGKIQCIEAQLDIWGRTKDVSKALTVTRGLDQNDWNLSCDCPAVPGESISTARPRPSVKFQSTVSLQ